MRNRAFRPMAAILSILFLAGSPVQAGPVVIKEVVQVVGNYHNPPELRLRSVSQTIGASISGLSGSTRADSRVNNSITESTIDVDASLLSGVALVSSDPKVVDVIDEGDVEGSICDCGEITVLAGGFPKWPLLFLAGIPFFFINDCDDCNPDDTPTPGPSPPPSPSPPPPPQIPEPASLLLFGSGLAAFGGVFRRRYNRMRSGRKEG